MNAKLFSMAAMGAFLILSSEPVFAGGGCGSGGYYRPTYYKPSYCRPSPCKPRWCDPCRPCEKYCDPCDHEDDDGNSGRSSREQSFTMGFKGKFVNGGIKVTEVIDDTLADQDIGLSKGDIIVKINGIRMRDKDDYQEAMEEINGELEVSVKLESTGDTDSSIIQISDNQRDQLIG